MIMMNLVLIVVRHLGEFGLNFEYPFDVIHLVPFLIILKLIVGNTTELYREYYI
jgi:hypothetical protein